MAGAYFEDEFYKGRKIMFSARRADNQEIYDGEGTVEAVEYSEDGEASITVKMDSDTLIFDEVTLVLR